MEDQKIAKIRRQVLFTLADGSTVDGEVFLNLYEARHERPQRVGELLNSDDAFIPVETAAGTIHLNSINIVSAQTSFMEEGDELMRLGEQYRVQIATSLGTVIVGQVFVNLPHERSRVSDYLNQRQRFCRVLRAEEIIYIGTRFILSVQD
jgi:hypothetical protein